MPADFLVQPGRPPLASGQLVKISPNLGTTHHEHGEIVVCEWVGHGGPRPTGSGWRAVVRVEDGEEMSLCASWLSPMTGDTALDHATRRAEIILAAALAVKGSKHLRGSLEQAAEILRSVLRPEVAGTDG